MHEPLVFAHVDFEALQQLIHLITTWRADFRATMIVGYYDKEIRACTISCKTQYFLQLLPESTFSPQNLPGEPWAFRVNVQGFGFVGNWASGGPGVLRGNRGRCSKQPSLSLAAPNRYRRGPETPGTTWHYMRITGVPSGSIRN